MQTAPRARSTTTLLLSLLIPSTALLVLSSCSGDKQPPAQQQATAQPAALSKLPANAPVGSSPIAPPTPLPAAVTPASPAAAAPSRVTPATPTPTRIVEQPAPQEPLPDIPADAQWTIYCYAVKDGKDEGHVAIANRMKAQLVQRTGRGDWYVIHGKNESNLYFGFYRTVLPGEGKDTKEVKRAEADLKMVKELQDKERNKPFQQRSAFVSLDAPDPNSMPEWNLYNVDRGLDPKDPKRAYWSLQIAAFRADPKRKDAAVDMVRQLRERGVEAYFYHGESISSVCVGHWPPNAVKAQNRTEDRPDVAHADSMSNLVVSEIPLEVLDPKGDLKARPIDNKPTATIAPKLEVLDPSMRAMMADEHFRYHAVNYEIGKELPNGKKVYNPSFLVEIPRAKGNGLYDGDPPKPRIPNGQNARDNGSVPATVGPRVVGSSR